MDKTKTNSYSVTVRLRLRFGDELISRVVNTLRNWLDVHYLEDQDASMLDRIDQFTEALHAEGSVTMATQLSNLVIRRVSRTF